MKIIQVSGRPNYCDLKATPLGNCNDRLIAKCFGCEEDLASPLDNFGILEQYDALFVTMSKMPSMNESRWLEVAWKFKELWPAKKLILYQEAEIRWPQYVSWKQQQEMYELLQVTDMFLAHNEPDAHFYRLLMRNDRTRCLYFPTIQDLSLLDSYRETPKTQYSVLIQHFDNRSNGLFAALIAKDCGASELIHFNTSTYGDGRNEHAAALFGFDHITEIRNCGWQQWAREISRASVYLHPITICAAGRDTIACAYLGVPVIGNKHLTAQQRLFPQLAVDVNDVEEMRDMLRNVFLMHPSIKREMVIAAGAACDEFTVAGGERRAAECLEMLK